MTLREVAERAGVSTATVSRVLNNPAVVQESTRKRVLEAAQELNYRPNRHAQSLAGGVPRMLGVVVSNITNPFFLDILHALERHATQKGYELLFENTDYRPERLAASVDRMLARSLAGFAVIASEADAEMLHLLETSKRPTATLDDVRGGRQGSLTRIAVTYDRSMRRVVEHLYTLGHRRMGFVGHHGTLPSLRARQTAFETTLSRYADVEFSVAAGEDSPHGGLDAMRRMLAGGFRPTAVLSTNDFMAVGVLRALREAGLRVPEDVSVTGFDNIELSEYLSPPLTTVDLPRDDIGRILFDALVPEHDRTSALEEEVAIEPDIILRESTAPPKP